MVRKGYLDHTWPYAAGSLCSTAGDLVRWNQALHGGEVLSQASYSAMITPAPLEDFLAERFGIAPDTDTLRALDARGIWRLDRKVEIRDGDRLRVDAEAGIIEVLEADFESRAPVSVDLTANEAGLGRELFAAFRQGACLAQDGASLVV